VNQAFLSRARALLQEALGDRLDGVVLYGSVARGDSSSESDIDLLVLLKGQINLWNDIQTIIRALYDLQLEIAIPIHAMPVRSDEFESGDYSIYRNAKAEGIFA